MFTASVAYSKMPPAEEEVKVANGTPAEVGEGAEGSGIRSVSALKLRPAVKDIFHFHYRCSR